MRSPQRSTCTPSTSTRSKKSMACFRSPPAFTLLFCAHSHLCFFSRFAGVYAPNAVVLHHHTPQNLQTVGVPSHRRSGGEGAAGRSGCERHQTPGQHRGALCAVQLCLERESTYLGTLCCAVWCDLVWCGDGRSVISCWNSSPNPNTSAVNTSKQCCKMQRAIKCAKNWWSTSLRCSPAPFGFCTPPLAVQRPNMYLIMCMCV